MVTLGRVESSTQLQVVPFGYLDGNRVIMQSAVNVVLSTPTVTRCLSVTAVIETEKFVTISVILLLKSKLSLTLSLTISVGEQRKWPVIPV